MRLAILLLLTLPLTLLACSGDAFLNAQGPSGDPPDSGDNDALSENGDGGSSGDGGGDPGDSATGSDGGLVSDTFVPPPYDSGCGAPGTFPDPKCSGSSSMMCAEGPQNTGIGCVGNETQCTYTLMGAVMDCRVGADCTHPEAGTCCYNGAPSGSGCGITDSKVEGTTCRASCGSGEQQMCQSESDCPSGKHCLPVTVWKTKFGLCF